MANFIRSIIRQHTQQDAGDPGDVVLADEILVVVVDDRGIATNVIIREEDHPGVIAEFETGTATTLLEAALDAEFSGVVVDDTNPTQGSWRDSYVPVDAP